MIKTKFSLYSILSIVIILVVSIVMFLYSLYTYNHTKKNLIDKTIYNSNLSISTLTHNIKNLILSYDINGYETLILNEMNYKDNLAIILEDFNMGEILGEKSYTTGKIRVDNDLFDYSKEDNKFTQILKKSFYSKSYIIKSNQDNQLGKLTIYLSSKLIDEELNTFIIDNIIKSFLIALLLIISLFLALKKMILNPISSIVNTLNQSEEDGIPTKNLPLNGSLEVYNLSSTINNMIQEIKNSNKKLKILHERLHLTLDGINDGIWDWDIVTNRAYFSKNWKTMLGFDQDYTIDTADQFFNLIHQDDKQKVKDSLDKHFKDPDHFLYSLEIRMKTKDGSYKWVLTRGKAKLDENNNPIRMLGSHTDIMGQKLDQLKLQEQKEELETIFSQSKDGIAILDLNSNFLSFNDAYLEMTGFSKDQLIKKSCLELTAPEDKQKAIDNIKEALENGYAKNFEKTCIGKDDKRVIVNMSITLMPDKKRLLATTKDVTSLKMVESQAKLASMGEMIANIAHQWRQPLSVISTGATGLKIQQEFGALTPEFVDEICDQIDRNAQYLSKTIDDFRDYIKGDTNNIKFNIKDEMDSLLKLMEPSIKKYDIDVTLNLKENFNLVSMPNELLQCFVNIFNNSKDVLKDINEDDRYIIIDIEKQMKNIVISFTDSGGGVDESIINRVFEPYFTTKHKSQGTGLGLHMTHSIVTKSLGGKVSVSNVTFQKDNKELKGAKFTIELPLAN